MPPRTVTSRRAFLRALGGLSIGFASGPGNAEEPRPPLVAAAADLKFALEELADLFGSGTGFRLSLTFGSSGNFARQIEQGAPFELFLSADESFIERLAAAGLTRGEGALYAVGRLVLFAPHGSPIDPAAGFEGLREAIDRGHLRKFAIANPEHAPYGRAAEQALRSRGAWNAVRPLLVLGENAAQAAQFAATGNAQGGIIPYSLALAPAVGDLGRYALIPAEWHAPLRQRMVLLRDAGSVAVAFYDFLQGAQARRVFARYGFLLPGEAS